MNKTTPARSNVVVLKQLFNLIHARIDPLGLLKSHGAASLLESGIYQNIAKIVAIAIPRKRTLGFAKSGLKDHCAQSLGRL